MRALAIGALLSGVLALPAGAQHAPDIAQRDRLVLSFSNCVLSIAEQERGNPNIIAEAAFQACATEEYAVRTWMRLNFAAPGQIDVFLINTRLNLKKMIRELYKS